MGSTVCYVLRLTEVRLPFKFVQNGEVSRQGPNFEEKEKNANSKRLGNLILLQEPSITAAPSIGVSTVIHCSENPCWKTPCANIGTCIWKTGENYTCTCKPDLHVENLLLFFILILNANMCLL